MCMRRVEKRGRGLHFGYNEGFSLPTHGNCQAFGVVDVEEGAFGDVDLAGTRFAYK